MPNFTRFEANAPAAWKDWMYQHPAFSKPSRGKLFLGEKLELSALEVSLNSLPKGAAMPFAHRHKQHEELYLFLSGVGQMCVDEDVFEVRAGSSVRVAPEGVRTWRNTGDEPLVYVVIQANAGSKIAREIEDGEPAPMKRAWPT